MPIDALSEHEGLTRLDLKVIPGAPRTIFPADYDEWRNRVVAKVAAPAQDGAANRELLTTIQSFFDLDGGEARLLRGTTSTRKTVEMRLPLQNAEEALRRGLDR